MKMKSKVSLALAAAAASAISLFTFSSPAGADPGDDIYQSCSTAHEITVDDNGVEVICEQWPYGGSNVWMPILEPDPMPTVADMQVCYVPGLKAHLINSGQYRVCSRHFDGYHYWNHF